MLYFEFKKFPSKASREGLYINEINELKEVVNRKDKLLKMLITIIISLLLVIVTVITYYLTVNNLKEETPVKPEQITKVITVDKSGKPINILTEKQ